MLPAYGFHVFYYWLVTILYDSLDKYFSVDLSFDYFPPNTDKVCNFHYGTFLNSDSFKSKKTICQICTMSIVHFASF